MRRLPSWSLVLLVGTILVAGHLPLSAFALGSANQDTIYLVLAIGGAAIALVTAARLVWDEELTGLALVRAPMMLAAGSEVRIDSSVGTAYAPGRRGGAP